MWAPVPGDPRAEVKMADPLFSLFIKAGEAHLWPQLPKERHGICFWRRRASEGSRVCRSGSVAARRIPTRPDRDPRHQALRQEATAMSIRLFCLLCGWMEGKKLGSGPVFLKCWSLAERSGYLPGLFGARVAVALPETCYHVEDAPKTARL